MLRYGWHPSAYQILNPGIELWFAGLGDAVVGFTDHGRVRVVAGEPVCSVDRLEAVTAEFESAALTARQRVCYLAAEARLADRFVGAGDHSRVLLGAHPVLRPSQWSRTVATRPSLRAQLNRARNKAVTIAEWPADRATGSEALRECLARWLASRGLPPLHFLVETETLSHLVDRRVFVATRAGEVVGFVVASPIPLRQGWLIEQVVRSPGAPNGTAELTIDAAVRAFAAEGSDHVALGVAPLSERAGRSDVGPVLQLTLAWVRAHSRRFYNFAGLESFKAKFAPAWWEPVYAISREPAFSFGTLWAIGGAYCAGSPLGTGLRAVGYAIRQELAWLRRRR